MEVIRQYLTKNDCYNSGRTIQITHMQLHSIGTPQPKATSLMSYWNQPGIEQMVHALVQYEPKEAVYEIMESNKRSWADAGFGNNHAYTVEMMEPDTIRYTSGSNYTDLNPAKTKEHVLGTYRVAVEYFAKKCKEFGLNPMAKKEGVPVVFSHREGNLLGVSSAHADPEHLWKAYGLTMDQFRKDVKAAMDGGRKKNQDGTYTVAAGDTLYGISKDFGCTVARLKKWNKLETDAILPGQKLKFYYWIGKVTKKNAPLKTGAEKAKTTVAKLSVGTRLEVLGGKKSAAKKKWYRVRYGDKERFIYSKWIERT